MSLPGAARIGMSVGGTSVTNSIADSQRTFPIRNESGEAIPPYSIVRLTDGERLTAEEGRRVHTIAEKPAGGASEILAITGLVTIPADSESKGEATQHFPAWVAYDPEEWTPANGDTCGAESGSWLAHPDVNHFVVIGPAVTDGDISRVLVTTVIASQGGGEIISGCCAGCVCMPDDEDLVTDCAAVPCLVDTYSVSGQLPFSGNVSLAHDTGCIYLSNSFSVVICDVDYGDYHWKLTVSDDPHGSELELVNDGTGPDIPLLYKSYKAPFNPICGNTFALYFDCSMPQHLAHVFPCEVCVVAAGPDCDQCSGGGIGVCDCPTPIPLNLTATLDAPLCPTLDGTVIPLTYIGEVAPDRFRWTGQFSPGPGATCYLPWTFYFDVIGGGDAGVCEWDMGIADSEYPEENLGTFGVTGRMIWGHPGGPGIGEIGCPFEPVTSTYVDGSAVPPCLDGCFGTMTATVGPA